MKLIRTSEKFTNSDWADSLKSLKSLKKEALFGFGPSKQPKQNTSNVLAQLYQTIKNSLEDLYNTGDLSSFIINYDKNVMPWVEAVENSDDPIIKQMGMQYIKVINDIRNQSDNLKDGLIKVLENHSQKWQRELENVGVRLNETFMAQQQAAQEQAAKQQPIGAVPPKHPWVKDLVPRPS